MPVLKTAKTVGLNLLLPPLCVLCRAPVSDQGSICTSCHGKVQFLHAPWCRCCGEPFSAQLGGEAECAACIDAPPPYRSARAVAAYTAESRRLITRLKFGDDTALAKTVGRWMATVARREAMPAELVLPVPLHARRLWRRGYNQSLLLADVIAKTLSLPVEPYVLTRLRATPPQTRLTRKQRLKNVQGAFAVREQDTATIAGKRVLLIDDVFTTGATIEACATTLLKAGAGEVHVLTFGRVCLEGV